MTCGSSSSPADAGVYARAMIAAGHPLDPLYLRRKRKMIVRAGDVALPAAYVATALKNLERLGYTCAPRLIERLRTLSERALAVTYGGMVATLRKLKGAGVAWQPMYPNFPRQVMDASDAELYVNALVHYLGDRVGARLLPVYDEEDRPPLVEAVQLEVIDLGDEDELRDLARALIGAATSISAQDKEDVAAILAHFRDDAAALLPPEIPHKENLAFVAGLLLDHRVASDVLLTRYFKTATDVLRLVVARSGGDVSLATPTKLKSSGRAERRLILALLDRIAAPDEDLWRHRERWLRVAERLHPHEVADRYPRAAAALARLRDGIRPRTFHGQVEAALRAGDAATALGVLQARPGELARRLDHLLRLATPDVAATALEVFAGCAGRVATPVLLQVLTHFEHRPTPEAVRPIFPKGNAARLRVLPNQLPPLPPAWSAVVVGACEAALKARFAELPPLGKVYVDPRLAGYVVPFSQRSASKALRTLVRGSRVPLPPGGTLRFFLWWKEGLVGAKPTGRVDIDLTAVLYDERFGYLEHISWTNLRSGKLKGAHSGDITSAPDGACEFIDLDLDSVRAFGGRYLVAVAYAYTSQRYCDLPECFVGWMMRAEPASGEIFEPSTVVDRVDLAADRRVCVPAIFDVASREVVWTDVAHRERPGMMPAIETSKASIAELVQAMTALHRATLWRLFGLHADARGTRVATPDEADTVFAVDQGVTPWDHEAILAGYLR
jgi:hypothetical protein